MHIRDNEKWLSHKTNIWICAICVHLCGFSLKKKKQNTTTIYARSSYSNRRRENISREAFKQWNAHASTVLFIRHFTIVPTHRSVCCCDFIISYQVFLLNLFIETKHDSKLVSLISLWYWQEPYLCFAAARVDNAYLSRCENGEKY